ncbi:MAG: hypothetical protein IJR14_02155, partial [Synergistaceae bacterium]|nr:hypothetical protein [Synergistaceae bacterium]
ELRDVEVEAISLVSRAANGERFKVFKASPFVGGGVEDTLPWTRPDLADEGTVGDRGGGLTAVDDFADSDARHLYEATGGEGTVDASEAQAGGAQGILDRIRSLLGITWGQGATVGAALDMAERRKGFSSAVDALWDALGMSRYGDGPQQMETSPAKIRAALDEFCGIAEAALLGGAPVAKSGRKISAARMARIREIYRALGDLIEDAEGDGSEMEATEMTKDDVVKVFEEQSAGLAARLDALEKSAAEASEPEPKEGEAEEPKADAVDVEAVKAAIEEALAPIAVRLERVEKARGLSNRVPEDGAEVSKSEDIWGGLF